MSDSQFNTIVILDAVPDGELNTARRLNNDLRDIADYVAEGLQVRYVRIKTYTRSQNWLDMRIFV